MTKQRKGLLLLVVFIILIFTIIVIKVANSISAGRCAAIGEHFVRLHNDEEAAKWFEKSLHLNPDNIHVEFALFNEYLGLRKYNLAIELLKRQLRYHPHDLWDFQRYGNLGELYLRLGDYKNAEELYAMVARQHPKAPLGFLGLANVYERKVDLLKAIEYEKQAIYVMENYYRNFPRSKIREEMQKLAEFYSKTGQEDLANKTRQDIVKINKEIEATIASYHIKSESNEKSD